MPAESKAASVLQELRDIFTSLSSTASESLVEAIVPARRIALYGVGREGLVIRSLAMRLYHLGLDAHVVGAMDAPPLGQGDLLIVSAGPGRFATVLALMEVAHAAGARTLVVTANDEGEAPRSADTVVVIPAQTMASDRRGGTSVLPMGSMYELALWLFFDLTIQELQARLGIDYQQMRSRHTNLE